MCTADSNMGQREITHTERRIDMTIGDLVFDTAANTTVRILEKIDVWGYVSYKVFNPVTGEVYKATEEQLKSSAGVALDENYLRYVTLLSKIKNETSGGFLSALSSGIIPLPHQTHVLNRAMATNNVRYILADEVGLGKTIEAGMIIKELKTRGLVQRVLVVCPTGLVTQWASEMQEKFGEKFHVILPSDYDTIRRLTDSEDVYGQYDLVISPMDSIKPIERHIGWSDEKVEQYNQERIYSIINSGWDLVIIDEAHRVAGSSSEVARYKLGHMLSQASPYLLLLSATPHNGKTEPFLRLVRLLDAEAFPNARSVVKEQVAPYLIRTEKREAIDSKGNLLFKKRYTHLEELHWDERHTMQQKLYELVSSYVAESYKKALRNRKKNMCLIFLLIMMQRMVTSSTAAIRASLERRLAALENEQTKLGSLTEDDLEALNIEDGIEEALEAMSMDMDAEAAELHMILEVAKQAQYQHPDVKIERLTERLDEILHDDPQQKIIIFTEFMATQRYLQETLAAKGYTTTILNGTMSIDDRNEAMREFRDKSSIFISTDAGGEGLNLQFSNIIINYDLPWNPMKIEQRCGRADRIGQTRDVHIYNFIVGETVENRVRAVLEEKLSVIFDELGVDKYSDVLDSEATELDFTEVYMRSIGHPSEVEKNMYPVESEVKQQLANADKYRDILKDEKDLHELVGQGPDFDVEQALHRMLGFYEAWQGMEPHRIENLGINDELITRHLNAEIVHDCFSPVMNVHIRNFTYENGYFMLWQLSVSDDVSARRIIPMFINEKGVYRPAAGKKIMDVFLNASSSLSVSQDEAIAPELFEKLDEMSRNAAYDAFVELRDKTIEKHRESYTKYMYALQLREEAAQRIGIENIRTARLVKIQQERDKLEADFAAGSRIYPEFKLMTMVRLEV